MLQLGTYSRICWPPYLTVPVTNDDRNRGGTGLGAPDASAAPAAAASVTPQTLNRGFSPARTSRTKRRILVDSEDEEQVQFQESDENPSGGNGVVDQQPSNRGTGEEETEECEYFQAPANVLETYERRHDPKLYSPPTLAKNGNTFTELFFCILLPRCFLAVVGVNVASGQRSGYAYDLEYGLNTRDQELQKLNLFGTYQRLNVRTGEVAMEDTTAPGRFERYPAKYFLIIPKVEGPNSRYTSRSIRQQLQELADFCNTNYEENFIRRRDESGKTYRVTPRTFGVRPDHLSTDPDGHLSDYIRRQDCVNHLMHGLRFGQNFYSENPELASSLMSPPYSQTEQFHFGYPP